MQTNSDFATEWAMPDPLDIAQEDQKDSISPSPAQSANEIGSTGPTTGGEFPTEWAMPDAT